MTTDSLPLSYCDAIATSEFRANAIHIKNLFSHSHSPKERVEKEWKHRAQLRLDFILKFKLKLLADSEMKQT